MTNEKVKNIVLEKSGLKKDEALKMYFRFFHNWFLNNKYIYKKFNVDFGAKILDIGCGVGHNLIHFSPNSVGIEKDEKFSKIAKSLGLNVKSFNVEEDLRSLIGEDFDLIWCTDFIVHTASPFKMLYDSRELLNDSGKIILQIPLMSVLNKHKSSCHLYAFNKKSLIYLLKTCGFKIIKTSGCVRRLPNFLNFIFNPLLQILGTNIWILAEKLPEPKINRNKLFLPKWINNN